MKSPEKQKQLRTSNYVVLPRRKQPKRSLRTLRDAVSKSWRGAGVVGEIRAQRDHS